jgi:hypothetical protein
MPDLTQVHIDRGLTNFSLAYTNETYVADQVAAPLPVDKRSDKYFIYNQEAFLRSSGLDANGRPKSLRRPKTEAAEHDFSLSNSPFYAEEYARKQLVTDAEIKIADSPLVPDLDATISLTELLKLDNEAAVANLVCTRANYNSNNKEQLTTGSTGTSWASYASANSNPLSDIKTGKVAVRKAIMREPNSAIYTVDTAQTLADHPTIKDLVKYTHMDALTTSGLPKVLRGLTTVEASQQYATNAEGAAFTSGNVWVDDQGENMALIYYRTTDVGPRSMHFARTFDAPDDTTDVRGINIRRYRWDPKKGWYIEAAMTRDWRLIAVDGSGLGIGAYLISGCTL